MKNYFFYAGKSKNEVPLSKLEVVLVYALLFAPFFDIGALLTFLLPNETEKNLKKLKFFEKPSTLEL